jgi:hypothetical protein
MSLKWIRLELARTPEFPGGSPDHGYEFLAPLNSDGHIDAAAWKTVKDKCVVTRFWAGEQKAGKLRHTGGGWRFDYDPRDDADDEPFFKLDRHALVPGAYVTITETDGQQLAFRVTEVTPEAA